jgi:hypothetical protein
MARRDRKRSLDDGQIPNPNDVRVDRGTGYRRVEGNRRASRNGPVSDLPPEVTIRFCNFFTAVGTARARAWRRRRRRRVRGERVLAARAGGGGGDDPLFKFINRDLIEISIG